MMLSSSKSLPFLFSGGEGYYQSLIMSFITSCCIKHQSHVLDLFRTSLFWGSHSYFKAWMFLSHLPSSLMGSKFQFLFLQLHEFVSSSAQFSTTLHLFWHQEICLRESNPKCRLISLDFFLFLVFTLQFYTDSNSL